MFLDKDGNVYDDEYFHEFQDGPDLDNLQLSPDFLAKVEKLAQSQKEAACVRKTREMLCSIYECQDQHLDFIVTQQLRNL